MPLTVSTTMWEQVKPILDHHLQDEGPPCTQLKLGATVIYENGRNHSRISFHRWVMQMRRKATSCSQMLFHSNESCMANTLRPENVLIFKRHNYLIIGICILQRFGEVTKKWVKYKALCSLLQGRLPGDTGQLQMATQAPNTGLRQGNTSWWDKSLSLLGQLKIKQVIHLKL